MAFNRKTAGRIRLRRPPTQPAKGQDEEKDSVIWSRKEQYFSKRVWAGSATSGT